jgi:hypothetical protein
MICLRPYTHILLAYSGVYIMFLMLSFAELERMNVSSASRQCPPPLSPFLLSLSLSLFLYAASINIPTPTVAGFNLLSVSTTGG